VVWDDSGIQVNFWPRNEIPADITLGAPQPDLWPEPAGRWPASTCIPSEFFNSHQVIFDTTLCGDWAGVSSVWSSASLGSCESTTGYSTCQDFVLANGASFAEACAWLSAGLVFLLNKFLIDWEVKSVKIYQQ